MHFITSSFKRFSKTKSSDPRQRVPLSDVVFEKEVTFRKFDFETSELEIGVSKSSI